MKTNMKIALVCILAGALLGACQPSKRSERVQIGSTDAGKTIYLQQGQHLAITLEGNPTTGYTWEAQPGLDQSLLKPVGDPEFTPDSSAVGSGGRMTLTYEAMNPGTLDLVLLYHRPWEQNVDPLQTFNITVSISQ